MNEVWHYTDLLKAHKFFHDVENRWNFYDAYMDSRDPTAWFKSPDVPLREGILLFGWVHSWDPNFQGNLLRFLEIYRDIFEIVKSFEHKMLIDIDFSSDVKNSLCVIFDRVANCCKTRRYESTDASKMLHAIVPELFVMWDDKIRNNIVESRRDGRCYAYEFMPNMQEFAKQFLDSYIRENSGDHKSASRQISKMAHEHTLAKLIDEFNYLRFTWKKTLSEIRSTPL